MKQGALIFATLLLLLMIFPSVGSSSNPATLSSYGSISYSPQNDYYSLWSRDYRVKTDFLNYLTDSMFDFTGFFDHLYDKFLSELETTVFGVGYQRPTLNYGSPTYSAGSAVGNLESVADYVCTTESEISDALSTASSGDIIFIKNGTYTFTSPPSIRSSNVIIAGEGWDTVLKMADNVNQYVFRIGGGSQNIIIRDLTIDGNLAGNPVTGGYAGLDIRGASNVLIENLQVLHVRQFGIDAWASSRIHTINTISIDSGWNTFEYTRGNWSSAIGNYLKNTRGVAMSTWASDHLVYANNVAVYGIHDGLSPKDGNWGIGVEPQGGGNPLDTHTIILRNNIASEHNQAGPDEPWLGVGIWVAGSETGAGTYNIIVDGNIAENNNRVGIVVNADDKYPELSNTIVVVNNYCAGNDVYNNDGTLYGNYVINRPGVVEYNNVEG